MSTQTRYALVTGCSEGGMGWSVAREFAERGVHTFATLRNPSKAGQALSSHPNITVLALDIASETSIEACAAEVTRRTAGRLDFLYNNAGMQNHMPLADQDMAAARAFWNTNFWGHLRTTQRFLPLLVEARGLVAFAGSVGARITQEFDGLYRASKAALASLADTLRLELEPLGVAVLYVYVGGVQTNMLTRNSTGVAAHATASTVTASGTTAGGLSGSNNNKSSTSSISSYNLEPQSTEKEEAEKDKKERRGLFLPAGSYYASIAAQIERTARGGKAEGRTFMHPDDFARRLVGDMLARRSGTTWRGSFASTVRYISLLPQWAVSFLTPAMGDSGLTELRIERERLATEGKNE